MNFKKFGTIIFWLIIQTKIRLCKSEIEKESNCLIHNLKYSYEYLYASNNIFTTGLINVKNPYHCIYTIPIDSVDDFSKLKWKIRQVNQSNSMLVTIMSNKDEYLCASNLYHDVFHQRRRVYLKGKNKNLTQNCEWKLEKVGLKRYIIWNDRFVNEKLYAPSFFYKYNSIKRYVYLWKNEPKTSSDEFKWLIDCGKGSNILFD